MINIIKYEFIRKSKTMGIFLAVILILNAVLVIRLQTASVADEHKVIALGIFFALLLWALLILYIIDMVEMYNRDLGRKGYMLYLTPNSGYKILGAKVIAAVIQGIGFLAVYFVLVTINLEIYGGIFQDFIGKSEAFSIYSHMFQLAGPELIKYAAVSGITLLVGIITFILMIYMAISIQKSFFGNSKFGKLISFILIILIVWLSTEVAEPITNAFIVDPVVLSGSFNYGLMIAQIMIQVVLSGIFFCVSAYLVEKRMDL